MHGPLKKPLAVLFALALGTSLMPTAVASASVTRASAAPAAAAPAAAAPAAAAVASAAASPAAVSPTAVSPTALPPTAVTVTPAGPTGPTPAVPTPPADIVGSPESSTVASADDLLVTRTRTDGSVASNWQRVDPAMTTVTAQSAVSSERARPAVRPGNSVSARPLDELADRAMSLQLATAGDAFLWTLGTSDDATQPAWRAQDHAQAPVVGSTYMITVRNARIAESADSGSIGAPVTLTAGNGERAQWSLVAGPDGYVRLVNRSDGLCLNNFGGTSTSGAPVATYACEDELADNAANLWRIDSGADHYRLQNKASGLYLTQLPDGSFVQLAAQTAPVLATGQQLSFTAVVQPGGVVPTWSTRAAKDGSLPSALAAGDLDRAVDGKGAYHDEVVAIYATEDHQLQIRVVDYNANASHLLVTGSAGTLNQKIGQDVDGVWYPGSVGVAIGDFNGDGLNEIAVTSQTTSGRFVVSLLSYAATTDGGRILKVLNQQAATSPATAFGSISLVANMAQTTSGDFEGSGRDDIAIGYGFGDDDTHLVPGIWVVSFTSANAMSAQNSLAPRGTADPPAAGTTLLPAPGVQPWTSHGVKLLSGLYRFDPQRNFILHRRELALVWTSVQDNQDKSAPFLTPTTVALYDVAPGGLAITAQGSAATVSTNSGTAAQVTAAPLSVSTGGFGGGGGSAPTLWGVATATWTGPASRESGSVRIFRPSASDGSPQQTYVSAATSVDDTVILTGYDEGGRSVLLGAPVVMHLQSLSQPTLIAQQPPAHEDWLNGTFINVSSTPELAVTMGSGTSSDITISHTTKVSSTFGVSAGINSKTTVEEGLAGLEKVGGTLDVQENFSRDWDSEHSDFSKYSSTSEYTEQASTADDDIVNAYLTNYTIYRYPILGAKVTAKDGGELTTPTCSSDCRPYYEVSVPGKTTSVHAAGRDFSWYQPTWQNNNALSYPSLVDGEVPTPDIGSYTYKDKSGHDQTSSEPLFNQSTVLSGSTHRFELKLSATTGGGNDSTTAGSVSNSQEIKAGVNVSFGIGVAKVENEEQVSVGLDEKSTWANSDSNDNATTTSSSFSLEVPQIVAAHGYEIGTAYYKDDAGVARVSQGVNLTASAQGKDWWLANYGQSPDLALNLPNAIVNVKNALGNFDEPKWSASPSRELIRGFTAIQPANPASPLTSNAPYAANPRAGDQVRFQVQVHNYSLEQASPAPVDFYAVPVDPNGLNVTGEPELIGSSTTPIIGAQGMATVTSPTWDAVGPAGGAGLQNYRIFVVLDPKDVLHEIHPLTGPAVCPEDDIDSSGGPATGLTDPMTGEEDTHACGQNNQGYGEITVMAGGLTASESQSAKITLAGGGLVSGSGNLQAVRGGGTATVGQTVHAVVQASTTADSSTISHVLVFDGPESNGNLIADAELAGADTANGGSADFSWTPTTAGTHVLHEILLAGDGNQSEQTLTVEVTAHGPVASVRIDPASATTRPGHAVTFSAIGYDQFGNKVGNLTRRTTFTVAGGRCIRSACSAAKVGAHKVTARYGRLTAAAKLTVVACAPRR